MKRAASADRDARRCAGLGHFFLTRRGFTTGLLDGFLFSLDLRFPIFVDDNLLVVGHRVDLQDGKSSDEILEYSAISRSNSA